MQENFLHYLWQYQLFNKKSLQTSSGDTIQIIKTGYYNENTGPDFLEAKIQIGEQLWAGSVEIHLKSSDWYVHNHEIDKNYDNVILHVVWENDLPVFRKNNTLVSALELNGLVPKQIWNNYQNLFQKSNRWIACENEINQTNDFIWNNWLERLYVERLEKKALVIESLLLDSVNDWEAVLFQLLAKNFGLKVNGDAFFEMAKSIDFSIIRKERTDLITFEALLIGQAGLLERRMDDAYYLELQQIYQFQKNKYQLNLPTRNIQFFRLRPPNFPTIRLSQLANLFFKNDNLFQKLMQVNEIADFYNLLQSKANPYWQTHYVFGKESKKSTKKSTKAFIDLLLINTLIPLRFAYQKHIGNQDMEVLFDIIRQIKPENNNIVKKFTALSVEAKNAMDSQALLTLKNSYCNPQGCLACAIGLQILKNQ